MKPCIMRFADTSPNGRVYQTCLHPDRDSRYIPDGYCELCKLRQETGTPPPTPPPFVWVGLPGPLGPTGPRPTVPRPDLAAIELTLPASTSNPTFQRPTFHDDGSIEYVKTEKEPLDIDGYVRDENNHWLFHPLWNKCALRHAVAYFKAACGCVTLVMRCNNPQSAEFGQRLAHTTCESCPVRKE